MEVVEAAAVQLETLKFNGTGLGSDNRLEAPTPGLPPEPEPQPPLQAAGASSTTGQTEEARPAGELAAQPSVDAEVNGDPASQWLPEPPPGGNCVTAQVAAGPVRIPNSLETSDSDSDSDSDSESDSDTDSDSSSSSSSSSLSSSSRMSLPPVLSDGEDDLLNEKENKNFPLKTKDELLLDELPSVEELTIILPEDIELKPLGVVSSIIEQLVIIESLTCVPPVNEDTVIFRSDRQAAGKIFEIFGRVAHPFYVLRYNSSEHIESKGIKIKDTMYFAPSMKDFTQYIFTEKLKQEKGSDASWKNDQEPPLEALDFSDDEKETEAKQRRKSQIQGRKKLRSEFNEPGGDFAEVHQNWNAHCSASEYSKGYHNREFTRGCSRGRYPRPCRGRAPPQQFYNSEHMVSQEASGFPPQRQDSTVMPQFPFPPPGFDMHNFSLPPPPPPPPSINMGWPAPDVTSNPFLYLPYSVPPPPPPPPPPPLSYPADSKSSHFGTYY
ncbi:PREDICTED: H/ACA ribonucleoprotein complex non-core subunit NAF1-like [Elephantulus edwardii]|uniref:H/ACA ribonucleoprotein complex non-core subunit NAF1-like n=1 Tax=Elephantulus edwardii TaxID=28737 RepID=UPI0003F0B43C|nr:PREDICTED: H/ACA ribonucleoprotein complex non-core subunit NAF1-like [Elephantulus edwardii]